MLQDAVTVGLGFAIGVLSGLFGVGGSSIATPLLRVVLDTPSLIALASPLPATFPTAATGLAAYSREGLVNRRAVIWSVAGGLPAVVVGALLTRWVPGHWLMVLIALAVAGVGVEMLRLNPYTAAESARRSTQLEKRAYLRSAGGGGWRRPSLGIACERRRLPARSGLRAAFRRFDARSGGDVAHLRRLPGGAGDGDARSIGAHQLVAIVLPGDRSDPGNVSGRPAIHLAAANPPQATLRHVPHLVRSVLPGDGDSEKHMTAGALNLLENHRRGGGMKPVNNCCARSQGAPAWATTQLMTMPSARAATMSAG